MVILSLDVCLLDTGHVMHINSNQSTVFGVAELEYSVDNVAALGCQMRYKKNNIFLIIFIFILFWINMFLIDKKL